MTTKPTQPLDREGALVLFRSTPATATPAPASSSIEVEVLLLGSAGVWAVGKTIDEAFSNANKLGSLGREVIIRAAPAAAKLNVDEAGGTGFYGNLPRDVIPPTGGKRVWPNRLTPEMRAAVDEAIASITADDVLVAAEHAAEAAAFAAFVGRFDAEAVDAVLVTTNAPRAGFVSLKRKAKP